MADYNSSLPVRTENNGDVVAKIVDGTITSQALAIDSSGRVVVKLDDGAGNLITSQANGSQRALDVGINVAGVQIDPRSIRALTLADVVTANQGAANTIGNAWPVKPTDGTNSQSFTAAGEAKVSVTQPLPAGTNLIGAVRLDDGAGNAITSQVNGTQRALDVGINVAGVQIDPRAIRALTSADVVTANIKDSSGAAFSSANPLPVTISGVIVGATTILDFKQAAAVAVAASDTHSYTVTAAKTFNLQKIAASSSGRIKVVIQLGASIKVVLFNSSAMPSIEHSFASPDSYPAATVISVIITNLDKAAEDVYSTIEGYET